MILYAWRPELVDKVTMVVLSTSSGDPRTILYPPAPDREDKIQERKNLMWQKANLKYHLLLYYSPDVGEGRFLETACGDALQVRRQAMQAAMPDDRCRICDGVWRLAYTSVDDARNTLRGIDDIMIIRRAAFIASSVTLKRMLEAKIRRLEKAQRSAIVELRQASDQAANGPDSSENSGH